MLNKVPVPLTGAGQSATGQAAWSLGARVRAAGTPVWAQPTGNAVRGVRVQVLRHAAAAAAGVQGVVFTAQAAGGQVGGTVRLSLDYAGFAQVYGGNYGLGLGLFMLPQCALATPQRAACRAHKRLEWVNDPASQTVAAVVTLPGAAPRLGARPTDGGSGAGVVLAAAPAYTDGGGAAGTYSATTLRASGTWSAGDPSGAFTYSYPMQVPPAASSLVPSVSLDYDSATVDGQTAATQAQASWVGDGWSTPQSFIEQSYVPCQDKPEGLAAKATPDECFDGPVLTLSNGGGSTPLVCPVATFSYTKDSTCAASADNGEVITHHVNGGKGTGTKFGDYWTVTDRDGTTYYFGLNHLPGWASGNQATNSVDSVPVFSAHSGDPCYNSTFDSAVCTMAYRWNLDYVTDAHGNAMAYYYKQSTNAYQQDGASAAVSYVRDSYLDHIDYGFTDGHAYTGHAPDQVLFNAADRCGISGSLGCGSHTGADWPDVPWSQQCSAGSTSCSTNWPSFWSTARLDGITTQQWNGSSYSTVDSWVLGQSFPPPGDETSATLWLASITRTGSDTTAGGTSAGLPQLSFPAETDLENRVTLNDGPALDRYRLSQIITETGATIAVDYELTKSCMSTVNNGSPPGDPSQNVESCFPVYWGQFTPGQTGAPDWFNKWAVRQVSVSDPTGGSPGLLTSYTYSGPAWHYDDNEVVKRPYRTYGQWRGYQDVKTYSGTGGDAQTEAETTYYQGMDGDLLPGGGTRSVTLTDSQGGKHADSNQLAGDVLESTSYNGAGGPVDHSTIYSYWVSPAVATRSRDGMPDLTANATGQVEQWSRQAITTTGPVSWRDAETDTSYDASPSDDFFGLPLYTFAHGDLSDTSQQTCASVTYAPANKTANIIGLAAETEVDAAPCGGSSPNGSTAPASGQINALTAPAGLSRPADVISDTRTFYDDTSLARTWPQPASPAWPQSVPATSDVSVVRQATGYSNGAFSYQTKNAAVYDSYGRPVSSYDANGNLTTTSYTMTNGVVTGQTVTNALGQATTTTYDPLRALPVTVTDPNNITTTSHYDGLGRLTGVWENGRPPATTPANMTYSYSVSNSQPSVVTTNQLNMAQGYITSSTLYDALLRVRQTQRPTPVPGVMLVDDSFYDSRGWQWKTNTNVAVSGGPGSSVLQIPDSQVHDQTITTFDGLGRPVLASSLDDSKMISGTASAYYGNKVTTAEFAPPACVNNTSSPCTSYTATAGGTPASTTTDALGRTTETDSYPTLPTVSATPTGTTITGGTTQSLNYTYNHRGQLADIKDAASGEDWTRSYNLLGQVTSSTTPNSGAMTSTYDPAGNLATATDANGHTISYSYDALNRKTGEYDGPSASSPPIATWVYDNANNAVPSMADPIGQLTTETSYSGGNAYTIQQQGFNGFGESLGETDTIPQSEGALAGSYTLGYKYDTLTGLPLQDTYPASPGGALPAETLVHGYTAGLDLPDGLSSSLVTGYVQHTSYNQYSQVEQETVGTSTTYGYVNDSYDQHTGALTQSAVYQPGASPTTPPVDSTSYTYDPFGNITSQADTRTTTAAQTEVQCFGYDSLGRLNQAWTTDGTSACSAGPSTGTNGTVSDGISGGTYWTSWKFDTLGDWTTQVQHSLTGGTDTTITYNYNGNNTGQPNTLTSRTTARPSGPSTVKYTYDAAGNMLTGYLPGGQTTLTWSHDDKLASATTSAGTTNYIYDADGNLLLQKDPSQSTLYLFGGAQELTSTSAGVTGLRFIALPGGGQVVRTGGGTSYSFEFTDQHATSLLTLGNNLSNPQWRQYTPYGAPRGTQPASWPDTHGFLDKPTDPNSGLTILGARPYNPDNGQFLSVDPVLDTDHPQTLNGYTYAADDPVTQSDPTGLSLPGGGGHHDPCGVDQQHCNSHHHGNSHGGGGGCPSWIRGCPGYSDGYTGGGYGPPGTARNPLYNPVFYNLHAIAAVQQLPQVLQPDGSCGICHAFSSLWGALNTPVNVWAQEFRAGWTSKNVFFAQNGSLFVATPRGEIYKLTTPSDVSNPLDMVPQDATRRELTPHSGGGAQEGVEFKWSNEMGQTVRLRIHGPDGTAPPGSNAYEGPIFRIQIGGRYMGYNGKLYPRNAWNTNSPFFDPESSADTHIPWPPDVPLPY